MRKNNNIQLPLKRRNARLKRLSELREIFFATTAENIHYKSVDESIFSKRFLALLTQELGSPSNFLAKSAKERREFASKINDLLLIEGQWKASVSKSRHDDRLLKNLFGKECTRFLKLYKKTFYPSKDTTHKQSLAKYGSERVKKFVLGFISYLETDKNNIHFLKDSPLAELEHKDRLKIAEKVLRDLESSSIFKDLVKICMKSAYDSRINQESSPSMYQVRNLRNPFLSVKRAQIMYTLQNIIVLNLTASVFNHFPKNIYNPKDIESKDIISYFADYYKKHKEALMKVEFCWFRDTFNIAITLIDIFAECGLILDKETVRVQDGKTTQVILWLNHKIENTIPFSHHLPRIIPPTKYDTTKAIKHAIKIYGKGELAISPSKLFLSILSRAQKKSFRINSVYLTLLDSLHNSEENIYEITPYPTKTDVQESYNNFRMWDQTISVSTLQRYINKRANIHIRTLKNKSSTYLPSLVASDITRVEKELNYRKHNTWTRYNEEVAKRQLLQTSITIARIYQDFPLFYGTKIDYRTRMYPWEYLLSRTTGELKQLLCDYSSKHLTIEGLVSLMTAYYRFSLEGSIRWSHFLLSEKLSKRNAVEKIKQFFEDFNYSTNESDFDCEDKVCYVLTLHFTLSEVFETSNKTTVNSLVEIDQVCSGIMLLSILLKVRPLAEQTNVLGGAPRDIYVLLMNNIERFFDSKGFPKGRVLEFLTTNRSCNKAILMRWGYSQEARNRGLLILELFKEHYGVSASTEEFLTIRDFAECYDDFLEGLFPKIKEQKKRLESVLSIRISSGENLKGMNIRTLDGCTVSWSISPTGIINKSHWNPITNSPETFKINIPVKTHKAKMKMVRDYTRGLFPNLIHSIDAAIMRLIIHRVWKRSKYTINQLHDCIICHPNIVPVVYEVIEEIYTDGTLDDLADKVFLNPMQEGLNVDAQEKIRRVREQFLATCDDFTITKGEFKPKHAYVFEGSVKVANLYKHVPVIV